MKVAGFFFLLIIICIYYTSCTSTDGTPKAKHIFLKSDYADLGIISTKDTIKIAIDSLTESRFSYFNFRQLDSLAIYGFYDKSSRRYSIYDLQKKRLLRKLDLRKFWTDKRSLASEKVYFVNFDSIYVYSSMHLYRIDTSLKVFDSIPLLFDPYRASTILSNTSPPVFREGKVYLPAFPTLFYSRKHDRLKWKTMYEVDFISGNCKLLYGLPEQFIDSTYYLTYLSPYYAYNYSKKNFVFSFEADTNIYVTDLMKSHLSYSVKSQYFDGSIPSFTSAELESGSSRFKAGLGRDSYGPVYYDSFANRYLRVAEQRLSKEEIREKKLSKGHSLIILNQNFGIIGESIMDRNINLHTLIITDAGIYARIDGMANEDTVYLIRLQYDDQRSLGHSF